MTHIKGEGHDDYDRLHHEDGTHRGSARSAKGSEVDWFDQRIRVHLARHDEKTKEGK